MNVIAAISINRDMNAFFDRKFNHILGIVCVLTSSRLYFIRTITHKIIGMAQIAHMIDFQIMNCIILKVHSK
jgi:hypothetical protein